ncbi:hypothetical protein A7X74_03350 [Stenotrophomonas maltophilia]|nr:hypothetical protein A7X74_03350 [Stenotrophomonas maltophilia]
MDFKVNDDVQSGNGPSMKVIAINADAGTVTCEWWANNVRSVADFPPEVLVKFRPRPLAIFTV